MSFFAKSFSARPFFASCRRFLAAGSLRRDEHGGVAVLFGLALVPVFGMGAAVLDYSRAATTRTEVQGALDATALMLARDANRLSDGELKARAQAFFTAQLRNRYGGQLQPLSITRDSRAINVAVNGTVPTALMGILGIQRVDIGAASRVAWGGRKVELALVLDNTGSMGDRIGGQRKIDALKSAANDLLTTLQAAVRDPDDVKVGIVPFDTQVRVDATAYAGQSWLRLLGPSNWTNWRGHIGDRDRISDYDTSDAAPMNGLAASLYPAVNGLSATLATIRPLTTDFTALRATVNTMTPAGTTNVAIGAAWGHALLSPGTPFTEGAPYSNRQIEKFMVVLTDGDNNTDRFGTSPSRVDDRTRKACDLTKASGIRVYTIRLLAGNAGLLRSCASRNDMYFDVQNAGQLKSAFDAIAAEITAIRLTQ